MRYSFHFIFCLLLVSVAASAQEMAVRPTTRPATTQMSATQMANADVETLVFLRHGEKPKEGFGQLTPQGLNRALALSEVLPRKYGKPNYLFAPDPREKVTDPGGLSNYIRPLATIEPTAISLGMPVQTPCGFKDIEELEDELCTPTYRKAKVFVCWEHLYEQRAVIQLLNKFGADVSIVPEWPRNDYDSLFVVKIYRTADGAAMATFAHEYEGLNGQSTSMPKPASM
jgi:hypothetical protein